MIYLDHYDPGCQGLIFVTMSLYLSRHLRSLEDKLVVRDCLMDVGGG